MSFLRRPGSDPRRTDKFTARMKKALHLAQEEAQRLRQSAIGTQHLLLGLVREGEGVAAKVLDHHGVDLDSLRDLVSKADAATGAAVGSETAAQAQHLTSAAESAVQRAVQEAQDLGHNFVGTEHLLLAVLHEQAGAAVTTLRALEVDPEAIAEDVLQVVSVRGVISSNLLSQLRGPKDHVLTCRVDDHALDAIDALVEAGIRSTRSDAAAWLIGSGIEANREFFEQVYATVGEIRRLRERAQALAKH